MHRLAVSADCKAYIAVNLVVPNAIGGTSACVSFRLEVKLMQSLLQSLESRCHALDASNEGVRQIT
jgi:hypothetical protein